MTASEILESLKHLSTPERLVVIEAASRLIREEMQVRRQSEPIERFHQMRQAALAVKDIYKSRDELTCGPSASSDSP